ncbi:MAG: hypothetical protein JNG89_03025 [Planctomycetaceae bacterium]|nr:hypothetical protein [Planctomycetaceae bacterium]
MSAGRRGSSSIESRRNAGTCLALVGLLAVGGGLFALAVVILPDLLKAALFFAFLLGIVLFHYLTWGRLLSRPRPTDPRDEETERPLAPPGVDQFGDD